MMRMEGIMNSHLVERTMSTSEKWKLWGFGGFLTFLEHKQRLLRVSSLISLIELSTYLSVMIRSFWDIFFMATPRGREGGTELMEFTPFKERGTRGRRGPSAEFIEFHSCCVTGGGIRIWKVPPSKRNYVDEGLGLNSN